MKGLHFKFKLYPKNLLEIPRIIAFMQASTRATFGHFACVFNCKFHQDFCVGIGRRFGPLILTTADNIVTWIDVLVPG